MSTDATTSKPQAIRCSRCAAFTLVELLVVIVVLAILIALVAGVSTHLAHNQKVNTTKTVIRSLSLALEEFKDKDPLRVIYNSKPNPSFGPYPPYQLRDVPRPVGVDDQVAAAIERDPPGAANSLANRLGRDLLNNPTPTAAQIKLATGDDANNDNRALYTYLKLYVPEALARIPAKFIKPLRPDEFVTSTGSGTNSFAKTDVLGIYDAWDVPLDYTLYVKVERVIDSNSPPGGRLVITDRKPAIRSLGIDKDLYDARVKNPASRIVGDNKNWIWSDDLPSPAADATWMNWATGQADLSKNPAGWVRAVALGETYGYYPDPQQDK